MAIDTQVVRGTGHPWDAETGWDGMTLWADSEEEFAAARRSAESKFWRLWLDGEEIGTGRHVGYFYKPTGQTEAWEPRVQALDYWQSKPWAAATK